MHLGTGLWELPWPDLSGPLAPLPEDEWRYFVISFAGMSDTLSRIEEACDLGPLDLEVGFTIHAAPAEGFAMQSYPARLFHVLEGAAFRRPHFFVDVTAPQVDTTRSIAEGLATYDHALLDLRPSIAQLRSLKALQHGSALRFLGYFAILEALLTHLPDPKDPYDSITRQVKKKVTLLNNRWQTPLGYAAFGGASSDTIWKAMYAYRSRLAHGSIADFASRDLQVLGDRERPLKLLMDTVKATMRYALVEPRLLVDLKDC
jgi:hypothetical protein